MARIRMHWRTGLMENPSRWTLKSVRISYARPKRTRKRLSKYRLYGGDTTLAEDSRMMIISIRNLDQVVVGRTVPQPTAVL